jgi:uncharacterized protein with ParB-like and HNH nuclease domain
MPTIRDIIEQIKAGFYTVPEIQRRFVWRNPQIRELASSIYNYYPIGAIVYWEIPAKILHDESLREFSDLLQMGYHLKMQDML